MNCICVYCGSNVGKQDIYADAARQLGREFLKRNIRMVYGGGSVGLMGIIADELMTGGGEVIGVIPQFLEDLEVGHNGITKMIVTQTMHERKEILADMADGFIAMPGGFGTMDELCEILTWAQLGLHSSPIGLLNAGGYYDPLINLFDHMVEEQFVKQANRDMVLSHEDPLALLSLMDAYQAPDVKKWIKKEER